MTRVIDRRDRVCLIGAGYVGLGIARELQRAGIQYDQLEAREDFGGNWRYGVYDSTHMITGKAVTEFPEFPMPASYPDFPTHQDMLRYLEDFASHFGLDDRIECGAEVSACRPLGFAGNGGWSIEVNGSERRRYDAVIVANGHHWSPNVPSYDGEFAGRAMHSYEYKRPADFGDGGRVLVVGAGNSACDIAVEAAQTFGHADISMRGGYWFFPKLFFGIPSANLTALPLPSALQLPFLRALLAITIGDTRRYGLPKPDHRLYSKDVTVNTTMLHALRHGRVSYRPEIARMDGTTVTFTDGSQGDFDTIVWATGYRTVFPFLDSSVLRIRDGHPVLIRTLFVPGFSNLYIAGAATIRAGGGDVIPRFGRLIAQLVQTQRRIERPINELANYLMPATNEHLVGGASDVKPLLRLAGVALSAIQVSAQVDTLLRRRTRRPMTLPSNPVELDSAGVHELFDVTMKERAG